ncbi:MAG: DUF6265 family protein [Bryobacteraceae bacterium]
MKRLLISTLLTATLLVPQSAPSLTTLNWLAANWTGPLGQATTEENWTPAAAGLMLGTSRTYTGNRLLSFEFLRIEQRPTGIFYVAQPEGRPPTEFKATTITSTEVLFENPQHDHPKLISYKLEGKALLITLEGDEKGKHVKQVFHLTRS